MSTGWPATSGQLTVWPGCSDRNPFGPGDSISPDQSQVFVPDRCNFFGLFLQVLPVSKFRGRVLTCMPEKSVWRINLNGSRESAAIFRRDGYIHSPKCFSRRGGFHATSSSTAVSARPRTHAEFLSAAGEGLVLDEPQQACVPGSAYLGDCDRVTLVPKP